MKIKILLIIFTLFQIEMMAGEDWTLKKDKSDIKVYTKLAKGEKLKSSKAEMIVDASVAAVLTIIQDVENYVNWVPKTKSAKILEQVNDLHSFYYSEIKSTIISNRDLILEIIVSQKGNVTFIKMDGKPNYIAEVNDLVRMPRYDGSYTLTALDNKKTKISLEYTVDPGGFIPAWMANTVAVDMPYDTFSNLQKQIKTKCSLTQN